MVLAVEMALRGGEGRAVVEEVGEPLFRPDAKRGRPRLFRTCGLERLARLARLDRGLIGAGARDAGKVSLNAPPSRQLDTIRASGQPRTRACDPMLCYYVVLCKLWGSACLAKLTLHGHF